MQCLLSPSVFSQIRRLSLHSLRLSAPFAAPPPLFAAPPPPSAVPPPFLRLPPPPSAVPPPRSAAPSLPPSLPCTYSTFPSLFLLSLHSSFLLTMGCASSTPSHRSKKQLRKPKPWKHTEPLTRTQLKRMRDEFWDTAPHYGGKREIWDALHAASEAKLSLAQAIVDSAGIIVTSKDLSTCYDERGARYDLPKYVLSEPVNVLKDE